MGAGYLIRLRLPKDATFPSIAKIADAFTPFLDENHSVQISKSTDVHLFSLRIIRKNRSKLTHLGLHLPLRLWRHLFIVSLHYCLCFASESYGVQNSLRRRRR